jgi:hypothetical protein
MDTKLAKGGEARGDTVFDALEGGGHERKVENEMKEFDERRRRDERRQEFQKFAGGRKLSDE